MDDHYIILADHGHLRIFRREQAPGQYEPVLLEIDAMDFLGGLKSYSANDSDMAGRFQGSANQSRGPGAPSARTGMSIDERLPMQREEERRNHRDIATQIERFLDGQPRATWDFGASAELSHAVLEALSISVRSRLHRCVTKDLVHQPMPTILAHFDPAQRPE